MPVFYAQLKASLENISSIIPSKSYLWHFDFTCTKCHEPFPTTCSIDPDQENEIKGSRGTAQFVASCKFCKSSGNADVLVQTLKAYTEDDADQFKTVVEIEARGIEPTKWVISPGFLATCNSGTEWTSVDFSQDDWAEYDEKDSLADCISEVSSRISKVK